jgi:tripartite-type tricarboxylate transporter receptor subunit TctC
MSSILHRCRIAFALALSIGALAASANVAQAQGYPERPIRLIVAFSAGGATDVLARQIANDLKDALGQPVVVENRPGANGLIGWTHVATSEPDGYTLLMAENALAISQSLYKHINFDPVRQLDAVCLVGNAPLVLVTSTRLKASTLPEFIALAKATPARLNYSSAGMAASPTWCSRCSGLAPASRPCMCPTRAAARRSPTSPPATSTP